MMRIELPWPHPVLSPNARVHWAKLAKAKAAERAMAFFLAKEQGARPLDTDRAHVRITFAPPDRRPRDRDNMISSMKAACDGIADVIRVDDSRWIVAYEVIEPVKRGSVYIEISEAQ